MLNDWSVLINTEVCTVKVQSVIVNTDWIQSVITKTYWESERLIVSTIYYTKPDLITDSKYI